MVYIYRLLMAIAVCFYVVSCGYNDGGGETIIRKKPKPAPALSAEVQGLLAEHCSKCHGPGKAQKGLNSKARLDGAKARIEGDTMPPGGGLSDEIKAKLLGG